jgi:hypothetical protein
MALKFLDSGALDPTINPIYEAETTPTSGLSAGTNTQPSLGSIVLDTANNICDQKWAIYSAKMTFKNQEEYMKAYREYLSVCLNTGVSSPKGTSAIIEPEVVNPIKDATSGTTSGTTSAIVEPEIVTPINGTSAGTSAGTPTTNVIIPNLGGFLGSLTGGGAGSGATEEEVLTIKKKPFPYWIIAVAVVGGYLIFRKK